MAKKYRILKGLISGLQAAVEALGLKEDAFNVHIYHHGGLKYVLTAYNAAPVIVDLGGTTSFTTGTAEPDWNTYITYSDDDSVNTVLVIDDSAVDMVTVGAPAFSVTWTVTDEWGAEATLTKEMTITA